MTTNYLTKYRAAYEGCHPYAATPQSCYGCPLLRSVNNWRIITDDDGDSLGQVTTIKNAILNYGPVYSSMYASGPGFWSYSGGVYEYWGTENPNHAIQIIGWDDSLTHTHGSGAWLIKNSWDTTWGASSPHPGCGWVAYGAANLGDRTSAICGYQQPGDMYYHDECGWWGWGWGTGTTPTAYGAARYFVARDSTLTAVDFWTVDVGMNYEIKIWDTRTDLGGGNWGFSNQLGSTQAGMTDEIGYYSVPLNTPVPLTGGNDFIVQVEFTTSTVGYYYPVPIDYCTVTWLPPWSGIATYSDDSYASTTGTTFIKSSPYDIGIRARAEGPMPDLVVAKSIEFSGGNFTVSYNVSNNGTATANASTTCKYLNGVLMETRPCQPLAPGESHSGTFDPEPCLNMTFNVTVCADNYFNVTESNEVNNCELNIVDCGEPDISVSPADFDVTLPADTTKDYKLTISNDGDAELSYDISDEETTGTSAPAGFATPSSPPGQPGQQIELIESAPSEPVSFAAPPPLSGTAEEIAYDDGEADYGWAWNTSGGAFAVRFTPSSYPVSLQTARIYLQTGWPDSDHELFALDIYDDDGAVGAPGTLLGTVNTTAANWGWWDVDISALGITVSSGDFYIAYWQLSDSPDCEALGGAYDDPDGRSWVWFGVAWSRVEDPPMNDPLDWMIRCVVGPADCPWLSEDPTSGTVAPGTSQNITVSINTTGLGSNYTAEIIVASNDPDENPVVVPVSLQVTPLTGYNITLVAGWNLVSLPFAPDSTAIADITAAISADVAYVQSYDAATGTSPWYVPGNPASSLTTMEPGFGYWLWGTAEGTIVPPT